MLPPSLKQLADLLMTLPSIGPRQAIRLAFHIANLPHTRIQEFATALERVTSAHPCAECFFVHDSSELLCDICRDVNRRKDTIAIVEKETDVASLERAKKFTGCYLVLGDIRRGGVLDDLQKLKLQHLRARILKMPGGVATEIILATNPTTSGDLSATVITEMLTGCTPAFTRLGRGLPTGGEIEFADEETLASAFDNRHKATHNGY